jgi:hypothetical protein
VVIRQGDMWSAYDEADLFFVTTNALLTPHLRLVMGAGMARQALERFPDLDWWWGYRLYSLYREDYDAYRLPWYGVLWPREGERLGAFQTKLSPRQRAKPELIAKATYLLSLYARKYPHKRIHLNFPGIGLGGLQEEEVLSILQTLPDNVEVWKR